jgi:hypothetical protein
MALKHLFNKTADVIPSVMALKRLLNKNTDADREQAIR